MILGEEIEMAEAIDSNRTPMASASSSRHVWAAGIASVVGWSLDLFDLFVLLYIAPAISELFFPSQSATLSLASVYASFAVTLLMRPVGSGIFGSYADRKGRRNTLFVSIIGVGLSTGALGLLPTYAQAGAAGPFLFILLRLVQGVFVGGVVASTHTLGSETIAPRLRGLFSGVMGSGAGIGALLASAVFAIVSHFFQGPSFNEWGWRLMFLSGAVASGLSLLIFLSIEESPLWKASRAHGAIKRPVRELFSASYRRVLWLNVILTVGIAGTYYLTAGFLPTFLLKIVNLSRADLGLVLIVSSLVMVVGSPFIGHFSEIVGRRRALQVTGIVNLIGLPLLYFVLSQTGADQLEKVTLIASVISLVGNAGCSIALIYLNERFPTVIRSTGTALSWNIGFACGGMMPTFVVLAGGSMAGIRFSLMVFIIAMNLLLLTGALITAETRGNFQ
jgi:MFS transporter, MHS family, proline/betaine transporter